MRSRHWNRFIAAAVLAAPIAQVARAEVYLTEQGAVDEFFPGQKLQARWVELSPAQQKAVKSASGERVPSSRVRVWWGPNQEAVFIDRVIGKHDFITYAVAMTSDGKVKGVEILDYRETYGYEVRRPPWRRQFVGKSARDPIRINQDIQNISGATLSSTHVTDGVRRIVQTYAVLKTHG